MNGFDTLEKEYEPQEIKEQLPENKGSDFSMEDYLDFAEKFPPKLKLAKDWVALFSLYNEILKYEEKEQLEKVQQKTGDKHRFNIGGEIYEISISEGIPKKITEKYNKKDLNRLFPINPGMTTQTPLEEKAKDWKFYIKREVKNFYYIVRESLLHSSVTSYFDYDTGNFLGRDKKRKSNI